MIKKYQIIYADPPYQWTKGTFVNRGKARTVEKEYPTMPTMAIANLPIANICCDDATLFLWATFPKLKQALQIMESWGFCYKTCAFLWVKQNRNSFGIFKGMGFYTRANAELCLLGVKGNCLTRQDKGISQIVLSPREIHSQKPLEVRDKIVQLYGNLPRIELFARRKVGGWDCWGNEVESDIEL